MRGAVLFALAAIALQTIPLAFEKTIAKRASFVRVDGFFWEADLSSLPEGRYYASLGFHPVDCRLLLDGAELDATYTASLPFRTDAYLGTGFGVSASFRPKRMSVACLPRYPGDAGRARSNSPYVVASYHAGLLLQMLRMLSEAVLGSALALLLASTFLLWARPGDLRRNWPYLYFAASGLIHCLISLDGAYYFFSGRAPAILYALSRNNLALSVIVLAGHHSRPRPWLWAGAALSMALSVAVGLWAENLWPALFSAQMWWYVAATAVAALDLGRAEARTRAAAVMRSATLGWLLLQLPVLWHVATGMRIYSFSVVPGMIAAMTAAAIWLRQREALLQERAVRAAVRMLSALEGVADPREMVQRAAAIVQSETSLRRLRVYLDEYCLGAEEEPGKAYRRLDGGEARAACAPSAVRLSGAGELWTLTVPLGRHAWLELEDDGLASDKAHEAAEIAGRLQAALKPVDERLSSLAAVQGHALEKLRSAYGDGRWKVEAGAVFADINDYSLLTELHGGPFSDFVGAVYLPALVAAVSRWAVPEFVRGDEVYLVSLKEFLPPGVPPSQGALQAAAAVDGFCAGDGARLCASAGFPALTMSIGANAGECWLICDAIKVRTSGRAVNDAKRLQEAAGKGSILAHASLLPDGKALDLSGRPYKAGPVQPVLIKKNLLSARELFRGFEGVQ